jgi:hypothetical protein
VHEQVKQQIKYFIENLNLIKQKHTMHTCHHPKKYRMAPLSCNLICLNSFLQSLTLILYLMHFNEFNGDANDVEDQDH